MVSVRSRLSTTANLNGPVSIHQAGSLPGVLAEGRDTADRLMHEIDATQRSGPSATTTDFFDIKGGFGAQSSSMLELLVRGRSGGVVGEGRPCGPNVLSYLVTTQHVGA